MSQPPEKDDTHLAEMLKVILRFAAGEYTARGTLSNDGSTLDGVMGGINILGEELEARIAEIDQAQQALAESEAQLSAIFNATQDGILLADAETLHFKMANSAICRMLGYSHSELLGLTINDIHPAEALPTVEHKFERQLKGEIRLVTLPVKRKDGSVFYADISASPLMLDGKKYITGLFRDITERIQAEENIHMLNSTLQKKVEQLTQAQSELEQHRQHLEQEVAQRTASLTEAQRIANIGNWEWDIINNTVSWSDEIYRIFGFEPQQFPVYYETFMKMVHPEDRQFVDDNVREALAQQRSYSIEHRVLRQDGTAVYVHESGEVILGDNGKPVSMLGTVQDISERKLAEEQIRKQHAIITQIIETIPMRVFWKDRSLHYLGCNTAFARDAGKNTPDELLGKDDFQMAWKEQAELYRADDQHVLDMDTAKLSYDEPQTTPAGEKIWCRTSKVPLHNEANEVTGILGVYEDITEYKKMELNYLESEKRFRNLTELTTDWVWQVDVHGTYVYSGEKICALLGYTPEEVVGKAAFDFMPPEEAARMTEVFQDIISEQKPFSYLENINLHKDGHQVYLEASGVPLFSDDGTLYGYFGTERDITQRKLAEKEIYLLATTDSLTGITNRREFSSLLEREVGLAKRYGTSVSLVMYDIDFFKRVNDTFGHDEGDKVLKTISKLVKTHIRATDIEGRWGGEEFMILMPQSDLQAARIVAEKLRLVIAEYTFDKVNRITVSFGVTTYEPHDDINSLLKRVDDALYLAKKNGRNRVETLSGEVTESSSQIS